MRLGVPLVIVLALGGGTALAYNWSRLVEENRAEATQGVATATAAPRAPTIAERLAETKTLAGALTLMAPGFTDTEGIPSPAAAALVVWASEHLAWRDLATLPRTKYALVMKDSALERGKVLCVGGAIIEIAADHSARLTIYSGGLVFDDSVVRFAAVHSTGELVQDSRAIFCGIATGIFSYQNTGGGSTHAVYAVGMFDLPENRTWSAP